MDNQKDNPENFEENQKATAENSKETNSQPNGNKETTDSQPKATEKQTNGKPKVNAKSTPKKSMPIKASESTKNRFIELAHKNVLTYEDLLIKMMDAFEAGPETVEIEKEVEKIVEVEKTIEVEKKLPENTCLVLLQPNEKRSLEIISNKRFLEATRKAKQGSIITPESFGEILRKSFFNKSRLYDLDNVFYTGLTSKDLK